MQKIENDCVGCGLPCLGNSCPHRNAVHLYCDKCGLEVEELIDYDGQEICSKCLSEMEQ